MKRIILILLIIAISAIGIIFVLQKRESGKTPVLLEPVTVEQEGISIEAIPDDFDLKAPKFNIAFTTHSGSLDFDVAKISILEDDLENKYAALEWQGPPPGGHHISGTLSFPALKSDVKEIKLTIGNGKDLQPFVFVWNLEK